MRVSSWKKRKLAFRRSAQPSRRKNAKPRAAAGQQDEGVRRERKPRPQQPRRKEGAEQRKPRPVAAKAPREERLTPVSDVSVLTVGQALKVKAGNNAMDATVLEITKDGVPCTADFWYVNDCTRRTPGVLETEAGPGMNTFFKITALAGLLAIAGHAFAG